MKIPIGTVGRIVRGDRAGQFVRVLDDAANTGGFLVVVSPDPRFRPGAGGDDWVETKEDLERYFLECHWMIDWSPDTTVIRTE